MYLKIKLWNEQYQACETSTNEINAENIGINLTREKLNQRLSAEEIYLRKTGVLSDQDIGKYYNWFPNQLTGTNPTPLSQ